jgi:pilus assembly protein FimV
MQKSWLRPRWFMAGVAATAAMAACGPTWAQGVPAAVLGQPLNFSVQLRTDTGEPVTPECIAAEVSVGERKLPAAQVRTALESLGPDGARIRVTTAQRIDEAVVSVQLTLGCQARVTRRFMLMAEAAPASLPALAVAAIAPTPSSAAAEPARPKSTGTDRAATVRAAKVERAAAPVRAAAAGSRLRLEPAEPVLSAESAAVEQAIEVVAQAATAMRGAMAAASAAEQRIKTLEQSVAQARGEANAQRELVLKLQTEVAAADNASRWLWPLQLALLAAALLAAALAWRLWRRPPAPAPMPQWRDGTESAFDELAHDKGVGRSATSPTPFVASDLVLPPTPPPSNLGPVATAPARAARAAAMSWVAADSLPPSLAPTSQRTAPLPVGARDGDEAPRDVSIEELIDLEQQAEFFVVLGQDSAAIDLLVEHLRLTGGGSPLPYLKLMEIHHRVGEHDAYERTRGRFNERFNAYAPAWAEGLQKGRGLEDYPGVVPRLTQVWSRPLDAMAELEALLFRKSRGDLFDLPAYREVLFLYALARDLFDRESADAMDVDLLLPLHAQGDMHATRPAPFDDLGCAPLDGADDAGGRPTAPVDLDLSTPDRSSSIFDPFDPNARRGRR